MKSIRQAEINDKGHLVFSGCDTVELAKEYGTPLYVISEDEIRSRCSRIREVFLEKYPDTQVLYASKAFSNISTYRMINEEGFGIDVVSGGELYTAIKAGFPMEKVYFHGNNKTMEEIRFGIDNNVGCFVIDNEYEMELIAKFAAEKGKKVKALLRITPGVSGYTHDHITTGQVDSKFGFPIIGSYAINAVKKIMGYESISFAGIHCHIGSLIFNTEAYRETARIMADFANTIKEDCGLEIRELNMGGGFGVYDMQNNCYTAIEDFTDVIMSTLKEKYDQFGLKLPTILIEPGRWLMGESGITLYTIGAIKDIKGVRKYVSVDGGMADNPRHALYQSVYNAVVANKAAEPCTDTVTIAGKCCESGDVLIRNLKTPKLQPGDILAVLGTGAYNYSMASNYNRITKPALIMVKAGQPRVIIKRETYDDLIRQEAL